MSRSGGGIASRGSASAGSVEVYFTTEAAGVPPSGKEGETCYITTDGTDSGKLIARYVHNGTAWVQLEQYRIAMFNYDVTHAYLKDEVVVVGTNQYQANDDIPANTVFTLGTTGATWRQLQNENLPNGFIQVKATSQQSNVTANSVIMFQSTLAQSGTDISFNAATGEFTLKAFRTYRLTGIVPWLSGSYGQFQWHNGAAYIGSAGHQENVNVAAAIGGGTAVAIAYITPSVDTKVTLKVPRLGATLLVNDAAAGGASATANIEVVAGTMPVTGSTTSFASMAINHNVTAANTDVTGVTVSSGSLPNSNGQLSLLANTTYEITTFLTVDSRGKTNATSDVAVQWVDATTNVAINAMGLTTIAVNYTESMARNGSGTFTYTPSANQTIKMRVTYTGGTTTLSGTAMIKQLGTTNVSQFVGTLTNAYNINYNYPQGTVVAKDGQLYQANSAIAAQTMFVVGTGENTWLQLGSAGAINENGKILIAAQTTAGLSNTWADAIGGSFTLPSAGTWNVSYALIATVPNGNWAAAGIFDSNNNIIEGSGNTMGTWNGTPFQLDKTFPITVTAPTTLKVRVKTYSNVAVTLYHSEPTNVASGHSVVSWTKVSGYIPAVGQVSNYLTMIRNTSAQAVTALADLIFNAVGQKTTDIDYNTSTGVVTLRAGTTYELSTSITFAGFTDASNGWVQYSWVDATTNTILSGTASAVAFAVNRNTPENNSASAGGIYTPTTNQTIKLRVISLNGTVEMRGNSQGYATIKQLGTTSVAQFVGMLSNEHSTANTYPKGTITVKNGFTYQANEIIPAGTAFVVGTTGVTWKSLNVQQAEHGEHAGVTHGSTKSDATFSIVPGSVFTIPSEGTWEIEYSASVSNAGHFATFFRLVYDGTGMAIPNSASMGGQGVNGSGSSIADIDGKAFLTVTAPVQLRLEWAAGGGSSTIFNNYNDTATASNTVGDTIIRWKKISGFLPMQPKVITTPVTIGATVTAPTKGTTSVDFVSIKDDNSGWCDLTLSLISTTGGTGGSGDYLFTLPGGYLFDLAYHPARAIAGDPTTELASVIPGSSGFSRFSNTLAQTTFAMVWDATRFRINLGAGGLYSSNSSIRSAMSSSLFTFGAGVVQYQMTFRFKKG